MIATIRLFMAVTVHEWRGMDIINRSSVKCRMRSREIYVSLHRHNVYTGLYFKLNFVTKRHKVRAKTRQGLPQRTKWQGFQESVFVSSTGDLFIGICTFYLKISIFSYIMFSIVWIPERIRWHLKIVNLLEMYSLEILLSTKFRMNSENLQISGVSLAFSFTVLKWKKNQMHYSIWSL